MAEGKSPTEFAAAVRNGDRAALARAITQIESRRDEDREFAYQVLQILMPTTGKARRIGISGPPGAGKSTLIDAYGMSLIEGGHRLAVLTVDPSSSVSGGSILGDKSRMARLAQESAAFIRPSPSDLHLGGLARRTREAMLFCEAAGYDRVVVETVGVGQSEIHVAGLVDAFVLLVQPGAGDELQGIKKGIVEMADILVVSKIDGDSAALARQAITEYSAALRYLDSGRPVLGASAVTGEGLAELATALDDHWAAVTSDGRLQDKRQADAARWLASLAEESLLDSWRRRQGRDESTRELARRVLSGETRADLAGSELAKP